MRGFSGVAAAVEVVAVAGGGGVVACPLAVGAAVACGVAGDGVVETVSPFFAGIDAMCSYCRQRVFTFSCARLSKRLAVSGALGTV